ncbi:hypothetical protein GCM10009760_04680 [Kitasatospora kazusensis]|uniref:Uncharacterized protein n=1 Tax=Kitasatospora kazusensis TaxID=407974 RepID=A0ABN2YRV0_9ACTN
MGRALLVGAPAASAVGGSRAGRWGRVSGAPALCGAEAGAPLLLLQADYYLTKMLSGYCRPIRESNLTPPRPEPYRLSERW